MKQKNLTSGFLRATEEIIFQHDRQIMELSGGGAGSNTKWRRTEMESKDRKWDRTDRL